MNVAAADRLEPMVRTLLPGYDSGILALIVITFLLVAIGFRTAMRLWGGFFSDMVQNRERENAFTEHTSGENWITLAMLVQTFVYEGLLVFCVVYPVADPSLTYFQLAAILIGLCAALFMAQRVAYSTVGYAFASLGMTRSWLRSFSATQTMLGFALMVPTLGALFYPAISTTLVWCGLGLYGVSRILFCIKGFRIFYTGIGSIFYFFLYLCALEVLPLILFAGVAVSASNI